MGNAAAEGLSHAVPEKGADYDMIVFGLQESTYAVRRSSSLEKDEVVMRSMMSNDESDCEGGGSTNVSDCENSDTVAAVVEWVMKSFGNKLGADPAAVQEKIMARLDINKDGKLDMKEFEELFKETLSRMLLIERARAKFNEFDANKNGFIDNAEIKQVVDWTLQAYPSDDITVYREQLMNSIDANKDG